MGLWLLNALLVSFPSIGLLCPILKWWFLFNFILKTWVNEWVNEWVKTATRVNVNSWTVIFTCQGRENQFYPMEQKWVCQSLEVRSHIQEWLTNQWWIPKLLCAILSVKVWCFTSFCFILGVFCLLGFRGFDCCMNVLVCFWQRT